MRTEEEIKEALKLAEVKSYGNQDDTSSPVIIDTLRWILEDTKFGFEPRDFRYDSSNWRKFKNGEPCPHKGCANHITHPCELCGRIQARGEVTLPEIRLRRFL